MIAASLGDLLWSLVVLFAMIQYMIVLFSVITDLFRSTDLTGGNKALWAIALFFVPLITLIVYIVTRGDGMGARSVAQAEHNKSAVDSYIRDVSATGGAASELRTAKAMLDDGTLTSEEFERLKSRLLA